jgi:dihydrolipoamide dehydrogenase
MKYDIIVLGSGPGGYVSAIRASLGLKSGNWKSLGGVCLGYVNKSIIEISSGFNYLKHASDYGLTVSSFDKDFLQ